MREGWESKKLGDVGECRIGLTYSPDDVCAEGGTLVLRSSNVQNSRITYEDNVLVQSDVPTNVIVREGDILICVRNGSRSLIGKSAMISSADEGHAFGAFMATFRSQYGEYVFQLLQTDEFKRQVHRTLGATINQITNADLKSFKFLFPSLAEQRKIAAILRTWDEALEKLSALRAAKAKRHVGLTHSLVFGGMQLEEFRGSNEATSYRWFQLPAVWGCKPISDLAVEISERNTDGDALDVLSCSKHDGFVRSLEYFKKQVFSADLTGYKKISRGDFGFPSNHVEEGSIGLQNLTETGVVSPIYTVFRFNPEQVLGEYAFAVLKTEVYRHIFNVSTSASVDRRGSLRWKDFSRLPFPVPSMAEQKEIAEVLRTSKSEVDALDAEIEALTRQKRGLMQKLLTGEWRVEVSDDEEAAA
ncbi:restriction endonuclease subunit S [Sulfitobacter dubius]|uniref:Type-1 restriction enzyme EcoKI specificity protein n=1 Tax=Sulfitobacter dubius TaxID=218673 RepID=A0ABY3ZRI6_9RHOB|nr:restriction endonuclease subunit S [Sulfitobacter dubius]UOA17221.1 Type-1 restriction enzyme EcoKI specificity protein [Sulfitobacter dubius]